MTAADGHTLAAYHALAAAPPAPPRGGLVVVQEIFGVNDHIRSVTDGFAADAAAGYLAIAPAVFDRVERGVELGYDADGVARGREIRVQIPDDAVIQDVDAAVAVVVSAGKVGVVGYCWGGSVAWLAAARSAIAASVGYYGGQIRDSVDAAPRCPVMLHFGETDQAIPLSDVDAIRGRHPDIPIHVYAGAGHGFSCDARASYHAGATATARERTLAFLAAHLG